jgi:L-alanine-DL-glutamate epimerase-like enolase superfamily enzyme
LKVSYHTYNLKFKHPFGISRGTKTHQPSLVVKLEHLGFVGYGEAPAIAYYDITVDKMVQHLEFKKVMVEKFAFTEPDRWWHYLHHLFPTNPFLVCALDMAGWDLYGKMKGKEVKAFCADNNTLGPVTDYTIGIDTVEKMVEKMEEKKWPIYKIKLGTEKFVRRGCLFSGSLFYFLKILKRFYVLNKRYGK